MGEVLQKMNACSLANVCTSHRILCRLVSFRSMDDINMSVELIALWLREVVEYVKICKVKGLI